MKTNYSLTALVLLAALLLAGCIARHAPDPVVPEGAQAGDLTTLKECAFQPEGSKRIYAAECGTLVVPENWDKPGSRLIALPVVHIPASGPDPEEPVFFLQGGPGQSNLSWSPPDWLLENHAVVMVGYRGVDGTVTLSCPDANRQVKAQTGNGIFSEQARAEFSAATRQCAAAYQEAGVDLSGYTIPGVVEDMEAARSALGFGQVNLFSLSYGTRVAQIYAYTHPDSLHRLVLIGVNTPGHFIWDRAAFDQMIGHFSELCAQDAACSSRTSNFAQTMYEVNHNMPERWLVFNIDPGTVRLGTHQMFFSTQTMPLIFDTYLAAGEGDPSGLAMMNLMASVMPFDAILGDQFNKGGTIDLEKYRGLESVSLGNSILGAPMSEAVWPAVVDWPLELIPEELREFQETNVEMLLVNGTVDFSTPPGALDEARPYFHNAQTVLLPEFSHVGDVLGQQPEAFERLITSYYNTGTADDSLYVYQPLSFKPDLSLVVIARLLVAGAVLVLALVILGIVLVLRRMRRRQTLAAAMATVLILAILLSIAMPALAQEPKAASGNDTAASAPAQGPTDPAELEAFLDELLGEEMEEHHIAGAAVSVVKDGELFFAKGYGYADLERGIPVDPEQTVFHIGSVGKLFTWTAVMQLVEQGKLDLDADINNYLDFRIPDTYPQPITLKHLLTHTAGFEELWTEVFTWDADELMPVGEWLASHIPGRVRPPGAVAAYSNYGANLAGYIVGRVSGQPYEQYLEENILNPLGMLHSTARVPLPAELSARTSLGYWNVDGVLQPVPDYPEYFGQSAMGPAGSHSSSITDMARFMIAYLQDGLYSDADSPEGRILKESTVQQMHSILYAPDPRIQGTAYGFFDFSDNGQRTLGHSGATLGFTTLLLLLPDQDLGVFVAYNSESMALTTQHFGFQRAFYDHYYPALAPEPIQPAADFSERASRLTGSYRSTESAYTTLEKFGNLMSAVEVSDPGDGTLLLTVNGFEMHLVEVEPRYFRQADGSLGVVFGEDERGRITHMVADLSPQYAFEKLDWYETPRFNMALALGGVLIFLSMIPVVTVTTIRNRRSNAGRRAAPRSARMATWILLGISLLNLLFVVATVLEFGSLGFPRFGVSLAYRIVLGLGVLSAVLTAGALVYTVLAWKERYWSIAGRLYYTLVTVAAVAFVWFLNYWNLLGWRL